MRRPRFRSGCPRAFGRGAARASGFSLMELMASIVVISLLAAFLLLRLNYYQEMAEKAAMESTARLVKTALQIRLAELIVANRQRESRVLEREDPVQWLERKPANYGGVYHGYPRPGSWYFDEGRRELVYVVNSGSRLEIDTPKSPKEVRFRARVLWSRVRTSAGTVEGVTGVTFSPVNPYRWPH